MTFCVQESWLSVLQRSECKIWCEIRTGGCATAAVCSDPAGPSDEPQTTSYWARCCGNITCVLVQRVSSDECVSVLKEHQHTCSLWSPDAGRTQTLTAGWYPEAPEMPADPETCSCSTATKTHGQYRVYRLTRSLKSSSDITAWLILRGSYDIGQLHSCCVCVACRDIIVNQN